MSAPQSTAATIDTNEGWTFAKNEQDNTENNDWGTAARATTTDGWNVPPAPLPPVSAAGQPHLDDHPSLHWTACYDDYCNTHRQSKDNNYYPRRSRRRRATNCDCPLQHPNELLQVTRERRLNPAKACADWY